MSHQDQPETKWIPNPALHLTCFLRVSDPNGTSPPSPKPHSDCQESQPNKPTITHFPNFHPLNQNQKPDLTTQNNHKFSSILFSFSASLLAKLALLLSITLSLSLALRVFAWDCYLFLAVLISLFFFLSLFLSEACAEREREWEWVGVQRKSAARTVLTAARKQSKRLRATTWKGTWPCATPFLSQILGLSTWGPTLKPPQIRSKSSLHFIILWII